MSVHSGIPVPYTVGVKRWAEGGSEDAHGNRVDSWAAPVPVPVHAVGPRVQEEPEDPRRYVVVEGLTVYAPAGTTVGAHDRVVWPFPGGTEYEVDGPVADWTRGPWRHPTAGVVVQLTDVRG